MKKPRFLTLEEQMAAPPPSPEPDLKSLVPFDTVKISRNCHRFIELIGPTIAEALKRPSEFYAEGVTTQGDTIIRDVCLPMQEQVTATSFAPTHNMIRQCKEFLLGKRKSTNQPWIAISSIHGHGNLSAGFSIEDLVSHADNFLKTQYLTTRSILDQRTGLGLLFNDFETEIRNGELLIADDYAYHPLLKIMGLPREQQEELVRELGIELKGHSTLDVIKAHLEKAATIAASHQSVISAEQHRVLGYNYFLVYDNQKNVKAMIGILVEDTVDHTLRPHYEPVLLEPVDVEDDIPFDEEAAKSYILSTFENIIARERNSIDLTSDRTPSGLALAYKDALSKWHQEQWEKDRLMPASQFHEKKPAGSIGLIPLVNRFFHSVLSYLDLAEYEEYCYSETLSDVLRFYASISDHPPFPSLERAFRLQTLVSYPDKDFPKQYFVDQNLDHLRPYLVDKIAGGLDNSKIRQAEIEFMRDFAFATHVTEQNRAIEKFYGVIRENGVE